MIRVLLFLCIPFFVFAQNIRVEEVLENYVILLEDSQRIRPADIELPGSDDPDYRVIQLAKKLDKRFKNLLYQQKVEILKSYPKDPQCQCTPAHFQIKYALRKKNVTELLLEEGYGHYRPAPDSIYYDKYNAATQAARQKQRGVWHLDRFLEGPAFSNYGFSIAAGGGRIDDGTYGRRAYSEVNLLFAPLQRRSGIRARFVMTRRNGPQDQSAPEGYPSAEFVTHYTPYGIVQAGFDGRVFGLWAGVLLQPAIVEGGERSTSLFPSLSINFGNLDRFYVSLRFVEDILDPITIGINIRSNSRIPYTWLGLTADGDGNPAIAGKFDFKANKQNRIYLKFLMAAQEQFGFGFRVGFTFAINPDERLR